MFKRFVSMALLVIMCLTLSSIAFAADYTSSTAEDANTFVDNCDWVTVEDAELSMLGNGWAMLEVPANAVGTEITPFSGSETWSSTTATRVGTFTMEGNNLTPVKTIKSSMRNLMIHVDSYSCSKPVILSVQIRKAYTNTVLGKGSNYSASTSGKSIFATAPISNGSQVQIFFRITDANGRYDDNLKCTITYSYRLVNDPFNP